MTMKQRRPFRASADNPCLTNLSDSLINQPDLFYQPCHAANLYSSVLDASSALFSLAKSTEPTPRLFGPLEELVVEGFDQHQIWEQLQFVNAGLLKFVDSSIDTLNHLDQSLFESSHDSDNEESADSTDELHHSRKQLDANISMDCSEPEESDQEPLISDQDDSGVASQMDQASDELDSDDGEEDDEQGASALYADFFGDVPPASSIADIEGHALQLEEHSLDRSEDLSAKVSDLFANEMEDEMSEDEQDGLIDTEFQSARNDQLFPAVHFEDRDAAEESKSTYEKQAERMRMEIEKLEFDSIQAKSWELQGEVSSRNRPTNSLLEEHVEFETVRKPVPIVSVEFTASLEDRIKDRIVARNFDNVERVVPPESRVYTPRDEVSGEKSKVSLSELYEQEYLKTIGQTSGAVVAAVTKQHAEISALEAELFHQLDALSNYFFTPKPLLGEVSVKSDVVAMSLEEAIPTHVSESVVRAPEEVYAKQRNLKSASEMSAHEKVLRRKKVKVAMKSKRTDALQVQKLRMAAGAKTTTSQAIKALVQNKNITILDSKQGPKSMTPLTPKSNLSNAFCL